MNKFITILLLVCISILPSYAQSIVQPSEPNEACMEAWTNYQKADALWKTGWGLFGAGSGLMIISGTLIAHGPLLPGLAAPHGQSTPTPLAISLVTLGGIGGTAVVASIPCLIVGQIRRKAARNAYDQNCNPAASPLDLTLQSSSNGLGLALLF